MIQAGKWRRPTVKTVLAVLAALAATLFTVSPNAAGEKASDFNRKVQNALGGDWGRIRIDARWRFEYVEQEGRGSAKGDPLRLRLGYQSPRRAGLQAFVEFEGNTPVFFDEYNSTRNDKSEYPVIADPAEAELNQGWLDYSGIADTTIKAGRQRITYNNQRFVGNVGWRQMEQTFDAVSIVNRSLGSANLKFAFVWNVRTISSRSVHTASSLLNLGYTFPDIGKITAYGYWLDYNDAADSGPFPYAYATQTYGLRFHGQRRLENHLQLLYTTEYAYQTDFGDNPKRYGAHYLHLRGGFRISAGGALFSGISAKVGWEYLGSDNGVGLQTPLGTNHAFQGWADQFLVTPPDGVSDLYGDLSARIGGVKLQAVYHRFDAAEGGRDYGHEIDALVSRTFAGHYTLALIYANYFAEDYQTDTRKLWAQVTVAF